MAMMLVVAGSSYIMGSSSRVMHPPASLRCASAVLALSAADESRIHREADSFFARIDDNGDGLISFDELSDHLASLGYGSGGVDHIFDLLDINRDGEISAMELRESFVKFDDPALRVALGLGETESDAIFDAIDTNSDGEISQAELREYLERNGYPAEVLVDSVFGALDEDSDVRESALERARCGCCAAAVTAPDGLPFSPARHRVWL